MNYIRERRRAIGLNQEELAHRLQKHGFNITRASVGHWETGRYNAPVEDPKFINALAKSLEIDTIQLLIGLGYYLGDETATEIQIAIQLLDKMTPEQRKTALKLLQAMAG